MNRISYSPQEILPLLDLWEKFVWIKDDVSSNKVSQPKYYPLHVTQGTTINKAKKAIKGREKFGRDLLAILSETTFSEKAEHYLKSVEIKKAVQLLLEKPRIEKRVLS